MSAEIVLNITPSYQKSLVKFGNPRTTCLYYLLALHTYGILAERAASLECFFYLIFICLILIFKESDKVSKSLYWGNLVLDMYTSQKTRK